ncbi:MAG: magnesium transporter, partial [Eubacteriaceae bacterium]|nr:magnesium transporter [Eubacteriaceae bacterium]
VGIVSVDDAIDVLVKETTEDIEAMGGVSYSEKPYMKTKIFTLSKNRIVWLLMLMISATVSGKILEGYETAFAAIPLLVTFIPMMMGTGGNAGSQTSTVLIRSMATGDIHTGDFLRVWFKEIGIGILAGFVLAVANYLRIMILHPSENEVGLVVSLSLWATVVIANSVATFLPMVAAKLKQDPAVMSAPLITTIVDAFALVLYFEIAKMLLTAV